MKKITEFVTTPLDRTPTLVQHFASLEGEGGTIGSSALYIRTNTCNLRCNFCFGTPKGKRESSITMLSERKKKISKIKKGDKLLTYNDQQELVETEVYNVINRTVDKYLELKIEGKYYYVTHEHPFFTTTGLKRADELKIGDNIIHSNGAEICSVKMKNNNPMKNKDTVVKSVKNTNYKKLAKKISQTRLERFASGELVGTPQTQDQKDKASKRMIENNPMKNKDTTKKVSITMKSKFETGELIAYHRDEIWCKNQSDRMIGDNNPMKNEETLRKNIESHNFGKSKVEDYFHTLCEDNDIILDFIGNNKLIIGNKVPDFIIPGTKKVIEIYDSTFLYTDIYRDSEWELKRIEHFAKHGYECLCIDMFKFKRIKDREDLLIKVRKYYHNGMVVEKIKEINKDLEVHNISCSPYNTYLIDNMWVHNCDTAFSVEGKEEFNIVDMTKESYTDLLINEYSTNQRKEINNLSITGGEPLLNLNYLGDMIRRTLDAFPNITRIIFETNGTMLSKVDNCYKLIGQIGCMYPKIKFMLSISPKLSGVTSYSSLLQDDEIVDIYKNIINNYKDILDAHCNIQLKFVHSKELVKFNEPIIDYAINAAGIHKNRILIMPFTPPEPMGRDKEKWELSKDDAANYAMKNFFRYSPRIHIDRRLD